jgi:hypothetical protein
MPLIRNNPKTHKVYINDILINELIYNSIKIVATTPDNNLNITPIYIEEGYYNTETKIFTSYKSLDEIILDTQTFLTLDAEATQLVLGGIPSCYMAEKIVAYNYVADRLGIPRDSYEIK